MKQSSLLFLTVICALYTDHVLAAPPVVKYLPVTKYVGEREQNIERLLYIFTITDANGDYYTCEPVITPPVVRDLPVTKYVGELEQNIERLLYIFTITDANGDYYTCEPVITVAPGGGGGTPAVVPEFNLVQNSIDYIWELWTSRYSDFDITASDITAFRVEVTCVDSTNAASVPQYVDVEVVRGEIITIDNVEGEANDVTVDALATPKGQLIKSVSATSFVGNDITFTMINDPSLAPLDEFFVIDESTGEIRTNREMKYLDSATTTMLLTVNAHDAASGMDVLQYLTVHMTNQNTLPTTANFDAPLAETKLESLASGTVLRSLTTIDPDSQGHTYSFTCTPTGCEDTFVIDRNGNFEIAPGEMLDYESIPFYNISLQIHDGIDYGGPFIYELTVGDDNEAPYFTESIHYATITEGAKFSQTWTPGFTCNDDDSGEVLEYQMSVKNDSNRFAIFDDGSMTLDSNYDVEVWPAEVTLEVLCVDSGGVDGVRLTGTTYVIITIEDLNDNAPLCAASTFTFVIDQYTDPGDVIGTMAITDADSGTNGQFNCSSVSTSAYSSFITVDQGCVVYLAKTPSFAYGTHIPATVTATDKGSPTMTETCGLDVIYKETTNVTTTTTTQATTTEYDFFDHGENIAMLVMFLLMSLVLLGLLAWCLARCCCGCCGGTGGGCQRMGDCVRGRSSRGGKMPRQVYPRNPPPNYDYTPTLHKAMVAKPVGRTSFARPGMFTTPPRF